MRFEDVLQTGKLWAVVYDGDKQDILTKTFENWLDPAYLEDFFMENIKDLESYFHITNLDAAIYDTTTDAAALSCLMLDIRPDANLDFLFRPLENQRIHEMFLSREKAKGMRSSTHSSWLRIMADREHTLDELRKMEKVRNYLLENGIIDIDGIKEDVQ